MLNRLVIALCLLWAGQIGWAADLMPRQVLTHADGERFWVARIDEAPGASKSYRTTVYYRLLGEDGKWQQLTREPIPARAVALASQNSVCAALLEDGEWMLLYRDGTPMNAGPLPAPARMVALAGSPNSWWAVGVVPGGMAAVIAHPATRAAAATQPVLTTQPVNAILQTHPFVNRLVLFQLSGNDWKPLAELSEPVSDTPSVSLAFVDDDPYVANFDGGGMLHVRHIEKGRWSIDATPQGLAPIAGFGLLSNSDVPRLWIEQRTIRDRVYTLGKAASGPIELTPIPASTPATRALAVAFGKYRMVAAINGTLQEQDFSLKTGTPDGSQYPIATQPSGPLIQLEQLQSVIVVIALIIAISSSFRQRTAIRGSTLKLDEIALAPFGRRFLAGLIDAAPMILATVAAMARFHVGPLRSDPNQRLLFMIIYYCAGIFYILYTTVIESLSGRSLGKVLMGLRVIGLDGQPAKPGALVLRNLMRVIEVGLAFIPLLMIGAFPLRQRAGDVAAGTLVVVGKTP